MEDYPFKIKVTFLFALVSVLVGVPFLALAHSNIEVPFSATFELKTSADAPKKLKIDFDSVSAKISDEGHIIANCSSRSILNYSQEISKLTYVKALDLDCRSVSLEDLSSPVSLVYLTDHEPGKSGSLLKFGTWLTGYRNALLTVVKAQ